MKVALTISFKNLKTVTPKKNLFLKKWLKASKQASARPPMGTPGYPEVYRSMHPLRRVLMRSVYGNGPCTVQAQCRFTHPRSPEGPERGVTPSAILLAHHPRTVYHLTFELGLQCPTIPAFSALSHCEAVVFHHVARGMSRMRFTEFFPKEPSSARQ